MEVLVAQSCLTLVTSVDSSPPGSSVHGILQARILAWVAILSSRESSQLRDRTQISRTAGRRFNFWATREALVRVCFLDTCLPYVTQRISYLKALIPFMRAPPSWPNHLSMALPPNIIALDFNIWILWYHKYSHHIKHIKYLCYSLCLTISLFLFKLLIPQLLIWLPSW